MGGLSHFHLKVGKHEGTSPCNQSVQLVPWWVSWQGLVTGTCPMNSSHKAFWGTSCRDLSPEFKPVWICGTSCRDQIATRFRSKNGQFTQWDLSLQLEAGSSRRDYSPRTCQPLERTRPKFPGIYPTYNIRSFNLLKSFAVTVITLQFVNRSKTHKLDKCCLQVFYTVTI